MSSYEDIGLSYVNFATSSDYAHLTLTNPITPTETLFLAYKFRISGGSSDPYLIQLGGTGASQSAVIALWRNSNNKIEFYRNNNGTYVTALTDASGTIFVNDGEDHIIIVKILTGQIEAYTDTTTKLTGTGATFGWNMDRLSVMARWDGSTYTRQSQGRAYWCALYSTISNDDITSLMAGASPLTVGTLRSGDSFWAFDGDFTEYNGGTSFTPVGSPTFVQPAFPNTLAVTDSYLDFDATQYAHVALASAITPTTTVWWAAKVRITGGSGDPFILQLGTNNRASLLWRNSSGKIEAGRRVSGSVSGQITTGNPVINDGADHTIILKISTGRIDLYVDNDTVMTASGSNFAENLANMYLNAYFDGSTYTRQGGIRFYWAYLYSSLSPADMQALFQGEHPASVGNVRQGYNLAGDGDEVNGGPALTLYNSPRFVVPNRVGLTRPLVSRLVSSLTSSLVSR